MCLRNCINISNVNTEASLEGTFNSVPNSNFALSTLFKAKKGFHHHHHHSRPTSTHCWALVTVKERIYSPLIYKGYYIMRDDRRNKWMFLENLQSNTNKFSIVLGIIVFLRRIFLNLETRDSV